MRGPGHLLARLVGFDDVGVVIGAPALIDERIRHDLPAALSLLARNVEALLAYFLRLRADMNLRLLVDALLFVRAVIVANIQPGLFHAAIEVLAPGHADFRAGHARRHLPAARLRLPHVMKAGRRADDLAALLARQIAVQKDHMRMRVVLVLAAVVMRRAPRDFALAEFVHEGRDRLVPLVAG